MRQTLIGLLLMLGAHGAFAAPINNYPLPNFGGPTNVINLFTTGPDTFTNSVPFFSNPNALGSWTVTTPVNGTFVQLATVDGSVSSSFLWLQSFSNPMSFAYQTGVWDYQTGTLVPGTESRGSFTVTGDFPTPLSGGPGYAAAGGPAPFVAPIPEPSLVLIGAMGLGVLGLRRRWASAPAPETLG